MNPGGVHFYTEIYFSGESVCVENGRFDLLNYFKILGDQLFQKGSYCHDTGEYGEGCYINVT